MYRRQVTNGYITVLDTRPLTFANSRKLDEKRIRIYAANLLNLVPRLSLSESTKLDLCVRFSLLSCEWTQLSRYVNAESSDTINTAELTRVLSLVCMRT